GCQNYCSYCVVPLVRKNEVSVAWQKIVDEIKQVVSFGYQEVVLTGTRVGAYRDGEVSLAVLLKRILNDTEIPRLRLSSLQPQEITDDLVMLWSDARMCPHFHLSLQSGSDSVLRRMGRQYSPGEYEHAVSSLRERIPDVAITTDIIVGFPGESDEEFAESYRFCAQMAFARIHVFPYSMRPGTEAAGLPEMVGDEVKKRREQEMLALANSSAIAFMRQYSGMILPVLWEKEAGGIWSGHTANYLKVYASCNENLINRLLPAKLVEVRGDGLWGELGY
ncbi:MiaB/RimO family radical SAM methylthiotransferase, partial [Chloroflexota bacterium]